MRKLSLSGQHSTVKPEHQLELDSTGLNACKKQLILS